MPADIAHIETRFQESLELRLRELTAAQLCLVDEFVSFLADASARGELAVGHWAQAPASDTSAKYLDISFAWLMRVVFGSHELAGDGEPVAELSYESLGTPLMAQEYSEWCWAAATQMIMAHYGVTVTQLELAEDAVAPNPKAPGSPYNSTAWPPFETGFSRLGRKTWGFTAKERKEALEPWEVEKEIDANRPFAVSWIYQENDGGPSGGHMLVVVGYLWIGDELWLVAYDPYPPGSGDRSLISHQHYKGGFLGTWWTYYEIKPSSTRR